VRIVFSDFIIANGLPNVLFPPNQQVQESAEKVSLPGAVLGLNPESLPFAMDGALKDLLKVRTKGWGEKILPNSLHSIWPEDDLVQERRCLWRLRFYGYDVF
jgi:hypothetical protein